MTDDLQPCRAARARRLRNLGLLGLALVALVFAFPVSSQEPPAWTPNMRAQLYVSCVETLDDPRFCGCAVDALVAIAPDPSKVTEADAQAAFSACPPPRPRAPDLKI